MQSDTSLSPLDKTRREALGVVALWILSCAWTVGYSLSAAYRQDPDPPLLFGIPTWVVWGVLLPWGVILIITCWAAFFGIKDENLDEDALAHLDTAEDLSAVEAPHG